MKIDGVRVAVCIPSKGRGARVTKLWTGKMAFLDAPGVYLGIDRDGVSEYPPTSFKHAYRIPIDNPLGSVSRARELVRRAAIKRPYDLFVLTDDNATFTKESLLNLVRAQIAYQKKVGATRPVIMAGMHGTAAHFDKTKVENAEVVGGWRSYARVSMMYWVLPGELYRRYAHPKDAFGYDDRHLLLWLISQGVRDFRICVDAPFAKARYQAGGQGQINERVVKNVAGAKRLYDDFPGFMGLFDPAIPWKVCMQHADQALTTRLGRHNAR